MGWFTKSYRDRLVPKLRRNLISLGMSDSEGYSYKYENGLLRVMRGAMVVFKGSLIQGLYILQGKVVTGSTATVSKDMDQIDLWHKRLGHISIARLQKLCEQGILNS